MARADVLPGDGGSPGACAAGVECCGALGCPAGEECKGGVCRVIGGGEVTCEGIDCPPRPPISLETACSDEALNGDETGTDCGGSCTRVCELGQGCRTDSDCAASAFCPAETSVCTLASCDDGVKNGAELGMDCGGGCAGCPEGAPCNTTADCESEVCIERLCAAPSCSDGVRNGAETDTDCGTGCPAACDTGRRCETNGDCQSAVCRDEDCVEGPLCCQAPSCFDGVANGSEPVVDCGNLACGLCLIDEPCTADAHCITGFCELGTCEDPGTCSDNIQNGRESALDCGGDRCASCRDLLTCRVDADCFNLNCDQRGICISCGDTVINGTETDFDCGGSDPYCQRCGPGQRCSIGTDCASGLCFNGFC